MKQPLVIAGIAVAALGIVALSICMLVSEVRRIKVGIQESVDAFPEAYGRTLYSSLGAWTRIQEFARAQGKSNYVAEAERKLAFIEASIKEWRDTTNAVALDFARFESNRITAYQTVDKNIKNGENPLAYLDRP